MFTDYQETKKRTDNQKILHTIGVNSVSYTHLDVYKRQMLHHPNFDKRFFINCDASNISLGSELYQEDEEGNHWVISFASTVLSSCERNYTVTEKELLSVVFSCIKFHTFILGYPVTIRTDHRSISFLKNCKLNHGRLTRWVLILQEYNLDWEYIPGKKNIIACLLYTSRCV